MKKIIVKVILIMLVMSVEVSAQEMQGIATYRSHQKVDVKLDSTQVNSSMEKQIQEMLKKEFQKTYSLEFTRENSLYKEEESLASPQTSSVVVASFGGSGNGDILYKNTKENSFVNQKEVMGKVFLIQDSLPSYAWKLENETKNIGEYTCFKATYTKIIQVPKNEYTSFTKLDSEEDIEMISKEIVTTAWYTPQIPISNGPAKYQGLPGLILEINDGTKTLICTSIVLNPVKKVAIEAPSRGKKISQTEYQEIMDQKMKEMQEMYQPTNRDNSQHIEIRIGG